MSEPINREKAIEEVMLSYQTEVRSKIDLIFQTIKLNSGDGGRGLEMTEACQWVDAAQNVLCTLFEALKALDTTENAHLTRDFIRKVRVNLETLANG